MALASGKVAVVAKDYVMRMMVFGAIAALTTMASAQASLPNGPISLRPDKAIVYGGDGEPLLVGAEDYLFALASNPDRHVFAVDQDRQRIRISPQDKKEYWLACTDVRGGVGICGKSVSSSGDVSRNGGMQPSFGRLPDCPGDPRCPN